MKTKSDSILAANALINISHCLMKVNNPQNVIELLDNHIHKLINAGISETQKIILYANLLAANIKINNLVEIDKITNNVDQLIINEKSLEKISPKALITYQFDKAEYYYNKYLSEGSVLFANMALDACWKMDEATVQYENQILTQRAQYLAKKTIDTLYKLPIEIAGKIENQEAFFHFTERSKNNLLVQDLGNDRYDLLPELEFLRALRNSKGNKVELNKKLVNLRKEKLNYLFLKNERKHIKSPSLSEFTHKLDGRYCLNYSFGRQNLYLQTINSQGGSQIISLGNSLSKEGFESFYKKVNRISEEDYTLDCGNFFDHLKSIKIDTSSILILPDNYLFLFPFDLLKTEKGPLFMSSHSYDLNASLFTLRQNNSNDQTIKNSVVVNPTYKPDEKDNLSKTKLQLFRVTIFKYGGHRVKCVFLPKYSQKYF